MNDRAEQTDVSLSLITLSDCVCAGEVVLATYVRNRFLVVFAVANVWPYVSSARFRSPEWMMVGRKGGERGLSLPISAALGLA